MKTNLHLALTIVAVAVFCAGSVSAKTLNHLFTGGLSYAVPSGGLADSTNAQPAVGFALGYLYRSGHHINVGVKGTWTQVSLGKTASADLSDFGITHVGLYGTFMYRLLRQGWTPYAQLDAGMGFVFADQIIENQPVRIDGLSEVKVSYAASVGLLVPVSDRVDADVSCRWFHTFVTNGYSMLGVQAGIVYALQ